MGTATLLTALNMDINGANGGVGSTQTFAALGALSKPMTPTGAVPEPTVVALLGAGCISLLIGRRFIRP